MTNPQKQQLCTELIPTFSNLPFSLIALTSPISPAAPAETRPTVYCELIKSLAKRHRSYCLQGQAAIYEPMHHMNSSSCRQESRCQLKLASGELNVISTLTEYHIGQNINSTTHFKIQKFIDIVMFYAFK